MSKNGLHLITPTSIASTGTGNSSSISANGSVTFSSCLTLSLNGVFSADYDNYMVVMRHVISSGGPGLNIRLRVSGTDNSTANSYVRQSVSADGTTVGGGRTTSNQAGFTTSDDNQRNGSILYLYGPYLAEPTAIRAVNVDSYLDAFLLDAAITHNQSTSYDGFTIITDGVVTLSGRVAVYGMRK